MRLFICSSRRLVELGVLLSQRRGMPCKRISYPISAPTAILERYRIDDPVGRGAAVERRSTDRRQVHRSQGSPFGSESVVHGLSLHLGACREAVDVDEADGGGVVEIVFSRVSGKLEVVERVG